LINSREQKIKKKGVIIKRKIDKSTLLGRARKGEKRVVIQGSREKRKSS